MSVLPIRLAVAALRPVCCAWCRNRAVTVTAIAPQKQKPGDTYEDLRCGSLTTVLHSTALLGPAAADGPGSLTACALNPIPYNALPMLVAAENSDTRQSCVHSSTCHHGCICMCILQQTPTSQQPLLPSTQYFVPAAAEG
jgi:hypothetical protein